MPCAFTAFTTSFTSRPPSPPSSPRRLASPALAAGAAADPAHRSKGQTVDHDFAKTPRTGRAASEALALGTGALARRLIAGTRTPQARPYSSTYEDELGKWESGGGLRTLAL